MNRWKMHKKKKNGRKKGFPRIKKYKYILVDIKYTGLGEK